MHGLHLTADLRGCRGDAALMTEPQALRALCLRAVRDADLTPVGELFHRFDPHVQGQSGITGLVLLAESHLAVHTWPEHGGATVDAYVCNFGADNSGRAQRLIDAVIEAFAPAHVARQRLERALPV